MFYFFRLIKHCFQLRNGTINLFQRTQLAFTGESVSVTHALGFKYTIEAFIETVLISGVLILTVGFLPALASIFLLWGVHFLSLKACQQLIGH